MAANRTTKGDGLDAYLMGSPAGGAPTGAFTSNVVQTSSQDQTAEYDGLSLHLIVDYQQDQVNVSVGVDNVVASTKIFSFANYTFTGLTGAKIVIAGAANAGNNGTFTITAVTAHTATASGAAGLVDETFGAGVSVFVIRSEAASVPTGSWKIFGANDFATAGSPQYGQPAQAGTWADITGLFTTPAAVSDAGSQVLVPTNGNCPTRHIRAAFTPTAGRGTARVARFAKSWAR